MTIKYELTVDDIARWQRFYFLSQRNSLIVFVIVIISALSLSPTLWAAFRDSRWLDVAKGAFIPVLLVGAFLFLSLGSGYNARRSLRNQPSLRGSIEAELTDNGCRLTSQYGVGENRWGAINEVVETRSLFMLKLAPQLAHILPKRAFSDSQLDEFRTLVRNASKGPKAAGFAGRWS